MEHDNSKKKCKPPVWIERLWLVISYPFRALWNAFILVVLIFDTSNKPVQFLEVYKKFFISGSVLMIIIILLNLNISSFLLDVSLEVTIAALLLFVTTAYTLYTKRLLKETARLVRDSREISALKYAPLLLISNDIEFSPPADNIMNLLFTINNIGEGTAYNVDVQLHTYNKDHLFQENVHGMRHPINTPKTIQCASDDVQVSAPLYWDSYTAARANFSDNFALSNFSSIEITACDKFGRRYTTSCRLRTIERMEGLEGCDYVRIEKQICIRHSKDQYEILGDEDDAPVVIYSFESFHSQLTDFWKKNESYQNLMVSMRMTPQGRLSFGKFSSPSGKD